MLVYVVVQYATISEGDLLNQMRSVNPLPGMKDQDSKELLDRFGIEASLRDYLSSNGYRPIDTPIVESMDLFLRKSGAELASQMYAFLDPGNNRVSLRPEFTSSVIRYYLEKADSEPLPSKMQYSGPVFRYDPSTGSHQFHQTGAEIIGASSYESDAAIINMAQNGLSLLGIRGAECVIGNMGVLHAILMDIGLSYRTRQFLIGNIPRLRQNTEEAVQISKEAQSIGLVKLNDNTASGNSVLGSITDDEYLELLRYIYRDSLSDIKGNRTVDEILGRLIRKMKSGDNVEAINRALSILVKLVEVRDESSLAMSRLRSILSEHSLNEKSLVPLDETLKALRSFDLSQPTILDISLVRGISYYTGMVFEIYADNDGVIRTFCGGGRYDGLVKALGGHEDVPALGFAYMLENILTFRKTDQEA